jgi:hypothetical protein
MMMEAVSTSETSVSFYQTTRRNIPEYSHFHTRHRENLKSRLVYGELVPASHVKVTSSSMYVHILWLPLCPI